MVVFPFLGISSGGGSATDRQEFHADNGAHCFSRGPVQRSMRGRLYNELVALLLLARRNNNISRFIKSTNQLGKQKKLVFVDLVQAGRALGVCCYCYHHLPPPRRNGRSTYG